MKLLEIRKTDLELALISLDEEEGRRALAFKKTYNRTHDLIINTITAEHIIPDLEILEDLKSNPLYNSNYNFSIELDMAIYRTETTKKEIIKEAKNKTDESLLFYIREDEKWKTEYSEKSKALSRDLAKTNREIKNFLSALA
jgi:hypothetical protein